MRRLARANEPAITPAVPFPVWQPELDESLDEVGIDVIVKVADIMHDKLGDRARPHPLAKEFYETGAYGKKTKRLGVPNRGRHKFYDINASC